MQDTRNIDYWSLVETDGRFTIVDRNGFHVADCGERRADAELIADCVNERADLVASLSAAVLFIESLAQNLSKLGSVYASALDSMHILDRARAVLAGANSNESDRLLQ